MSFSDSTTRVQRLRTAVDRSYARMEPFRLARKKLVEQYTGTQYRDMGVPDSELPMRTMTNLLSVAREVFMRGLLTKTPRTLTTTKNEMLEAKAARFEVGLNRRLIELNVIDPFQRAISDGLDRIGTLWIGRGYSDLRINEGETEIDPGATKIKVIDLDDLVVDMRARRWEEVTFHGHWFELPLETALESGLYKGKEEQLKASVVEGYGRTDIKGGEDRVEELSGDRNWNEDDYVDMVRLVSLWLPLEKRVVTLARHGAVELSSVDWVGPARGPYVSLSFSDVPGNLMPCSVLGDMLDLHVSFNLLATKTARKGERQKTVTGVRAGGADDANRVLHAEDGQMIRLDNPDAVREFNYGGPDGPTVALMLSLRDMFSWRAGNLDALGGLSPQADTLGQERLLNENASGKLRDMQDRVLMFIREAVRRIGWHEWHDPFMETQIERRFGAFTDVSAWTPEERVGPYEYEIDIHPYSLRDQSPGSKLETLLTYFERVIHPNLPMMVEQGNVPDFGEFARLVAKYSDMDEIDDIMTFANGAMYGKNGGEQGMGGGMPQNTTRTYERVNRPGGTRQGKDEIMARFMMGGGGKASENAAIGRPVG